MKSLILGLFLLTGCAATAQVGTVTAVDSQARQLAVQSNNAMNGLVKEFDSILDTKLQEFALKFGLTEKPAKKDPVPKLP